MDDEMIGRTQHRPLLGITVPVIPVEDNIIFKPYYKGERTKENTTYKTSNV